MFSKDDKKKETKRRFLDNTGVKYYDRKCFVLMPPDADKERPVDRSASSITTETSQHIEGDLITHLK